MIRAFLKGSGTCGDIRSFYSSTSFVGQLPGLPSAAPAAFYPSIYVTLHPSI